MKKLFIFSMLAVAFGSVIAGCSPAADKGDSNATAGSSGSNEKPTDGSE